MLAEVADMEGEAATRENESDNLSWPNEKSLTSERAFSAAAPWPAEPSFLQALLIIVISATIGLEACLGFRHPSEICLHHGLCKQRSGGWVDGFARPHCQWGHGFMLKVVPHFVSLSQVFVFKLPAQFAASYASD